MNESIEKETLELHDDVLFRRVAGEGVVVDQRRAEVIVVNEWAVRVLELIRETRSRQGVIDQLLAEYEVTTAQLESDLDEFLRQLDEHDMLAR